MTNLSLLHLRLPYFQVQKDVLRTDRALEFYAGDNNPNVDVLYNMLMSYCQYNYDLGQYTSQSDFLTILHAFHYTP